MSYKKGYKKSYDPQQAKENKEANIKQATETTENMLDTLADLTNEAKGSETFQNWLKTQSKFHNYSFNNTMLILCQKPEATKVAGFDTWKGLGRYVKKDEKGLRIWAPRFGKKEERNKQTGLNETKEFMYFVLVPVFDISQTEGKELPVINHRTTDPDIGLLPIVETLTREKNIQLEYVPLIHNDSECYGCSYGGRIEVKSTLQGSAKVATLIHEITHELLHKGSTEQHKRSTKEVEAESVAYVVLTSFGIDMSASSFYLAAWNGNKEEIQKSMDKIAQTSKEIINYIQAKQGKKNKQTEQEKQQEEQAA